MQPQHTNPPTGTPSGPTPEPDPQAEETIKRPLDFTEDTGRIDLRQPFSWQAKEGTQDNHTAAWYILFGLAIVGLILLAIFVFKSYTFAALIPVMAIALIMLLTKEPRVINYSVSPKGIYVGDKLYDYSEFRAFGVIQDPKHTSIIVLPVKRFSPGLNLYFDQKDGEAIVDMLGARLPIQEVKIDSLEKIIRLLRL